MKKAETGKLHEHFERLIESYVHKVKDYRALGS